MEEQAKPRFDYVRFARRVFRKRWWIIAGLFLLVVIPGAVLIYSTAPRLYEATAVLFFEELKEQHPLLRGMTPPEASALNLAILQSRSLAQAVVDVLPRESKEDLPRKSVAAEYVDRAQNALRRLLGQEVVVYSPHQEALTGLLQARMNFNVLRDGRVIVAAEAFSPRVATDLANTYVDVLLSRTGSQARDQARAVREMLDNLLLQTKSNLVESEEALRRNRGTGGDGVAVTDQARLELARLAELESQLQENQVNQEIARSRLSFLRGESQKAGSKAPLAPAPRANDSVQMLRERQSELETKLAGLSEKYTDKHPLIIATRAEVEEAQDKLRLALKGHQDPRPGGSVVLGPAERAALSKQMADLEVELATLSARESSLTQRVERGRRALSMTSGRELEYTKVMRAVENQRNLFNLYAERISQARMSEQSQIRNIRVIDLATMPSLPSTKPMLKMLLVVLMAGLGLGLGAATLLEYVHEVVETEEDVVRITGLPVLGSIPIVGQRGSATGRDHPLNFREATSPASVALEASRAVATSLELRDLDSSLKTIMITSASAGDGKTTTLLNLGEAMAETDRRVLLIDADLRRPALHRALRMPNEVGLSDVLGPGEVGMEEASRHLDDCVAVVTAGARPENPGALLGSKQVKTLLQIARARADMVLFDSAPVMAVSDNLHLASLVDGVVMVVRSGVTQRRSLARARARLDKASARVVGVIVNGLSPRDARHYYSEYTAYVSRRQHDANRGKRWLGFWPLKRKGSGS
jgi:succinoglycan biosynthesis transport protein ExoP